MSVPRIQELLKGEGYYEGDITGMYDKKTADAVTQFQRDNQMDADGLVGLKTAAKLRELQQRKQQ